MHRTTVIAATVASAMWLGTGAHAASFDCHKARTGTEKTICDKITISILDQRMAHVYRQILKIVGQSGQRDSVRSDQRYWLNVRDTCGSDADCLRGVLRSRIDELNGMLAAARSGT